jgi:hypothetical protein
MPKKMGVWLGLFFFFVALTDFGISADDTKFKPGFHLKLTGGGFQAAVGDMNTHLGSINDFYRNNYQVEGSGGIKTLGHLANEWQLEAVWDISPKMRWGLATSQFTYFRNESIYRYADIQTYRIDREIMLRPEIEVAVPVRLSLYYSVYSAGRLSIHLHSGIGLYYAGMKERMSERHIYPSGNVFYDDRFWSAQKKTMIGWHGGVSAECSLGRNLALVAEVQGRYLKLNDLTGFVKYTNNYGYGLDFSESGTLHFFSSPEGYYDICIPMPVFWAYQGENRQYVDRKAVLDLSGFSFRLGIRIRVFGRS